MPMVERVRNHCIPFYTKLFPEWWICQENAFLICWLACDDSALLVDYENILLKFPRFRLVVSIHTAHFS
jgi:hypothetical protein